MGLIDIDAQQKGEGAGLYKIASEHVSVEISTLGATIVSLLLPDRFGQWADVVLGFDSPEDYLTMPGNLGATIGRYAGRIRSGEFFLSGKKVILDKNRGMHTIHGGPEGFHQRIWSVLEYTPSSVCMELISPDGDQGFPGELRVRTSFGVEKNCFRIVTACSSDATTVCSLTNHAYWNLAGHSSGTIDRHWLMLASGKCLEADDENIPTGKFLDLAGSAHDFRMSRQLRGIEADHTMLLPGEGIRFAGQLSDPDSGRSMMLYTDFPAIQLYTGDHLPKEMPGKHGACYGPRSGLCLETQFYPDSPNHENFSSTILAPGECRVNHTEFVFHAGSEQACGSHNIMESTNYE